MRKQIAAANWKMNLKAEEAKKLLSDVMQADIQLNENEQVIFSVPFPYLVYALQSIDGKSNYFIAAQNCSNNKSGAYTGEVSVDMLTSIGITHCIVGHSERREYYGESNEMLKEKTDRCLEAGITPIFCCGEPLEIREKNQQDKFVEEQLRESLFHLSSDDIGRVVIAYEPIWAIGTGKTATAEQAQQMHAFIRSVLKDKWGADAAERVSILYGGSVKANNAVELFQNRDVDGGLVGGASLVAPDFIEIIKALRN